MVNCIGGDVGTMNVVAILFAFTWMRDPWRSFLNWSNLDRRAETNSMSWKKMRMMEYDGAESDEYDEYDGAEYDE